MTMDTIPALEIKNLRVDYGSFTAVDDISMTLMPGEIYGLVGPNGAGKTSTIRVLATLLEPTYGEISVLGKDLFEEPEFAHGVMAYMPDLAPVIPDLKVWEFLDLYAASTGLSGAEKDQRVDECLEKVKLGDKRNVYGKGLSRGMMQRVVLAKSLLHRPRLLMLDEPASGLDPVARRDMRIILQEVAAEGACVLVSSHILSELAELCTSVGIMHEGKLITTGKLDDVLSDLEMDKVSIEIELLEPGVGLSEFLEKQSNIESVKMDGVKVSFEFTGGKPEQAKLIKDLVNAGLVFRSFIPKGKGIESLLMDLIEET